MLRPADGFFTYMGSDAPETTADGRPGENYFMDNEVLSTEMGVKIKEADNTVITGESIPSYLSQTSNHRAL